MKKISILFFVVVLSLSCDDNKRYITNLTVFQAELNSEFKDVTLSPLKNEDRLKFNSLEFYNYDSLYLVQAKFRKLNNELVFKMKTTTERLPEYVKYGEIKFKINGNFYELNLYQNQELIEKEGYENYLFLPFMDDTNGVSSYSGGRYIDLEIPTDSLISIDFNNAYNPYSAYNEKYSCPIVPRENYLNIKINAGVKSFKKID